MPYSRQLPEANQLSGSDPTDTTNIVAVQALRSGGSAKNGKWGVELQSLLTIVKLSLKEMNIITDLLGL